MLTALLRLALVFVLVVLAVPAAAQEASVDLAEEADLQFQLGIDRYREGDYTGALEHLLASNRLVPNRNVVFNVAKCYEKLGDFARAWRHYTDYVALEPDAVRRRGGEQALDLIRAEVALIRITTTPPGATVYVDRRDLGARGKTPLSLALAPGPHEVFVDLAGHVPAGATAEVVIGSEATVDLALAPVLGRLRVDGRPEGAQVHVDEETGPVLGAIPAVLELPPGPYVLVVTADGYRAARQIAQVDPARESRTVVDLSLVTGTLVVDAIERDALVEVDGRASGFTPAVLEVPAGTHRVRVSLRGYRPWEADVAIRDDQSTAIEAQLRSVQEVMAASRTSQAVEDAPASVSIVTSEEIRAFGYTSVYEALAGLRGIYQTNDLTYESLGFRGFSRAGDYGNRVLTTIDGHRTNDDQLGASYVGADLLTDLRDVERIELVRGPGSALYGSNAFFGVVNVVTRDGATMLPPHVGLTGDGLAVARGRAGASTGDEDRGAWLSVAGASARGGDYVFPEYADARVGPDAVGRDGFVSGTTIARAWTGDWDLEAYYGGRSKEIPTGAFETVLADPRAHTDDHRVFGEVRYEPELSERTRLYARATLDHYRFLGDYPYGSAYVYSDRWVGTWAGVEPRVVSRVADPLTLTVGAEVVSHFQAHLVSIENSDLEGGEPYGTPLDERPTFDVYSAYAVGDLDLGPVDLSAGARFDVFTTTVEDFSTLNPRLGVLLHPSDRDVVKLLAGTAFRSPSPYEYFYDDGGITQVPPSSLAPERIRTAEVELTHRFGDDVSFVLAAFGNRIDGLVDLDAIATGPDAGLFQYGNTLVPVQTLGGEVELRRDWRQGWMAALQQSYQHTREGDLLGGGALDNSPAWLAAVKGAAPVAGTTTLATRVRTESPRLVRDGGSTDWAVLWDLTLTGELRVVDVDWGLGVRNVLDWAVEHPTGGDVRMLTVPQPGRTFFASVITEF